ncbi:hypothetical protein [Streptomyces sp. NPDC002994]|uniref:hypothetical protein n=1 Tax=Streptomyces sp. NPDC002994 TaxID=3154441 RepID=UPI0033A939E5
MDSAVPGSVRHHVSKSASGTCASCHLTQWGGQNALELFAWCRWQASTEHRPKPGSGRTRGSAKNSSSGGRPSLVNNSRCRMHICVRDDVQGRLHFGTAHPPEMLLICFGSVARKSSGVLPLRFQLLRQAEHNPRSVFRVVR